MEWHLKGPLYSRLEIDENGAMVKSRSQEKGKAVPLQAWTGPEGSRRLRLPDFMTIGT